ncbi:ABC transporter ATP-binding protein [Brachybacterium phenoliresistens]|uniref:ABC transporter ATP-binding protein n=1 Tax=Brachybacterium phenoliresistens TaxID=396014 RepID=UPI0031D680FA
MSPTAVTPQKDAFSSSTLQAPGASADHGAIATIRRGLSLTPEALRGIWITLLLAVIATAGKIVVPIAVQRVIDHGIIAPPEPDMAIIAGTTGLAALVLLVTAASNVLMNRRLFRTAETALATLRERAFRHIHDLSLLTQGTEQRGALVSRVTSDVDTVSQFMSFGGIMLVVMSLQLLLATVVMAVFSWPLALVVWIVYIPMFVLMGFLQKRIRARYQKVRTAVGGMLGAVSESLVGAATLRAYGITGRAHDDNAERITEVRDRQFSVLRPMSGSFVLAEAFDGISTAVVIVVGIYLGTGVLGFGEGMVTAGQLVAFVFLVSLFSQPVRMGAEMLSEAQNAVAGWRRVLGVLDTPADVSDPAGGMDPQTGRRFPPRDDARELPDGGLSLVVRDLRYRYPTGPEVLHGIDVELAAGSHTAIVGETGSGKTTFAKLLTRMMDPSAGQVLIGDVPVDRVPFASLRRRVVMVPQDGFLFDTTVAGNLRYGRPEASDRQMREAIVELGLEDWLDGLPRGLDTRVGQRGEALSAGERQLVSLARAYLADPDVIVLDEATSAVDPAADVRLQHAIEGLARGRTTVTIAHRLSTAERADQILVLDRGHLVERGTHAELVALPEGIYAGLHGSWVAHRQER